jgi:hypothetical protein
MGLIPRRRRHSSGSSAAVVSRQQRGLAAQTDGYWCAGVVLGRGRLVGAAPLAQLLEVWNALTSCRVLATDVNVAVGKAQGFRTD